MTLATLLLIALLSPATAEPGPGVLQRYAADGDTNWSSLILYTDNTFKYESRGGSCFAWHDRIGTWSRQDDLLILSYAVTIVDDQERIAKMGTFSDSSRILVLVSEPGGAPLKDVLVTFNGHGYESPTGADGRAFVDYDKIPEFFGSGTCKSRRLEQLIVKDGSRMISFSIAQPLSNYFEVILDAEPVTHEEVRQDVYRLKARKVVLLEDGSPEHAEAFGDQRPKVLRLDDE